MDMPLHPSWLDTAIRLTLTMLAGTVIGFNRGARGRAAGFRTTILVGLAASVAMIQANILLSLIAAPLGIVAVVKPRRLRCFPSSASERRQGLDRFQ
jgi:putative Mg2+ transporter-C (MgtC) family protein